MAQLYYQQHTAITASIFIIRFNANPIKKPIIPPKPIVLTNGIILLSMPLIFLYYFLLFLAAATLLSVLSISLLLPRYLSIARRIYLLLGISPRFWSIFCIIDLGKVIPSFMVIFILGATIVLLVILVECTMHIAKSFSIADYIKLL